MTNIDPKKRASTEVELSRTDGESVRGSYQPGNKSGGGGLVTPLSSALSKHPRERWVPGNQRSIGRGDPRLVQGFRTHQRCHCNVVGIIKFVAVMGQDRAVPDTGLQILSW